MIKYILRKNGQETNSALFPSREVGDAWLSYQVSIGSFRYEDLIIPAIEPDELGLGKPEEVFPATHTLEVVEDWIDQELVNLEAQNFLASTDWMIIRSLETGIPVPSEVLQARAEARARVQ